MSSALAFAFGALAANGLFDVVYKRAARAGVPAHTLLMTQAWCFTALIVAFGLATGTLVWNAAALWGGVAGALLFAGLYNFARSLKHGALSVNAPVFRMNFIVTALLAVALLGESPRPAHWAGLLLAAAAAWLLLGGVARGGGATAGSLARVLVATLAMGIANLVYKLGMNAGATAAGLLSMQAAVFVSLATLRVRRVEGRIRPGGAALAHGAAAAAMLALGLMLLLAALELGPASRLVPIAQMGFVLSAAVGITVLGERWTPRVAIGLAMAVAALAGLAWATP
jgi:drug/metabolite transporter (DMT)-like permease